MIYLFAPALEVDRRRFGPGEPCARFLGRQHEERRSGYLRIRRRLFLLVPGIWACWWGSPSSWPLTSHSGPWLFLSTVAVLILVWIEFGKAANKAARERDDVLRTLD